MSVIERILAECGLVECGLAGCDLIECGWLNMHTCIIHIYNE